VQIILKADTSGCTFLACSNTRITSLIPVFFLYGVTPNLAMGLVPVHGSLGIHNFVINFESGRATGLTGKDKDKGKVKLSLCLTKHHGMKTCWGSGDIAPRIL
jgi:hypothetical protein